MKDGNTSIANDIIDRVLNSDETELGNFGKYDEEKKEGEEAKERPELSMQTYVVEMEVKPVVSMHLLIVI